jgi:hypothetical protein
VERRDMEKKDESLPSGSLDSESHGIDSSESHGLESSKGDSSVSDSNQSRKKTHSITYRPSMILRRKIQIVATLRDLTLSEALDEAVEYYVEKIAEVDKIKKRVVTARVVDDEVELEFIE